jgi:Protein of unknown function (DUF3303)
MQYVIRYTTRVSSDAKTALANSKQLLQAFAAWKPPAGVTITTHVVRLALDGGFILAEAADPALIAAAASSLTFWQSVEVIPVIGILAAVPIAEASLAWAEKQAT